VADFDNFLAWGLAWGGFAWGCEAGVCFVTVPPDDSMFRQLHCGLTKPQFFLCFKHFYFSIFVLFFYP